MSILVLFYSGFSAITTTFFHLIWEIRVKNIRNATGGLLDAIPGVTFHGFKVDIEDYSCFGRVHV